MLIDNFEKAEQALDKCKTDFKTFYRAAMFCYGTYYYTLAMMNIEPDKTEHIENNKKAKDFVNSISSIYRL